MSTSTTVIDDLASALLGRLTGPIETALRRVMAEAREDVTEPMLSSDDLAARLDIDSETVRRWIRRDPTFPHINVGSGQRSVYRMRLSEVVAWMRGRS
jgi:hypothetical protein